MTAKETVEHNRRIEEKIWLLERTSCMSGAEYIAWIRGLLRAEREKALEEAAKEAIDLQKKWLDESWELTQLRIKFGKLEASEAALRGALETVEKQLISECFRPSELALYLQTIRTTPPSQFALRVKRLEAVAKSARDMMRVLDEMGPTVNFAEDLSNKLFALALDSTNPADKNIENVNSGEDNA